MAAIKQIDYATDYTWGSGGSPTWNTVTDFLADGLEPGIEDIITYEGGDGADAQDAVKLAGEFKATGANIPTAGTRTWIRFTLHDDSATVVGGSEGCRIGVGHSSVRPLGGGPAYKRVMFSATGKTAGDLIEADQT